MTPVAITDHAASGILELRWPDGTASRLPHPLLRRRCRCGQCENDRRRHGRESEAPASIRITDIRPIGDNALNLAFNDGHERGIYPWAYLLDLAREHSASREADVPRAIAAAPAIPHA
jgi:DUF971 family protein